MGLVLLGWATGASSPVCIHEHDRPEHLCSRLSSLVHTTLHTLLAKVDSNEEVRSAKVHAPPPSPHRWLSRRALSETDESFPECALASKVDERWILFEAQAWDESCPRSVSDV